MKKALLLACFTIFSLKGYSQYLTDINSCYYMDEDVFGTIYHTRVLTDSNYVLYVTGGYADDIDLWNAFTTSTTLTDFFTAYGPSGTNQVRLQVTLLPPPESFVDCVCCIYGDANCPGSLGNWVDIIPSGSIINYIDYTTPEIVEVCDNESFKIGYVSAAPFFAIMPDGRYFRITSQQPSYTELYNILMSNDTLNGDYNAKILHTTLDSFDHCTGQVQNQGQVLLSNNGNQNLTQATIGVSWDGVLQDSIDWTGDLAPYRYFVLDSSLWANPVVFGEGSGDISFRVLSVNNGMTDPEPGNDNISRHSSGQAYIGSDTIVLEWKTSNFTTKKYFQLITEDGTEIFTLGNPLAMTNSVVDTLQDTFSNQTIYRFYVDISAHGSECLTFRFFGDHGGNFGNWVKLFELNEGQETEFFHTQRPHHLTNYNQKSIYTTFPALVGTDDIKIPLTIYPNPALQSFTINTFVTEISPTDRWVISDPLGRIVLDKPVESLNGGLIEASFSVSSWPQGMYYVVLVQAKGITTSGVLVVGNQ
jgi:hypothetical protein